METADIALMNDELGKLPFVVRLSRATMHTIYTNVAFSIGIKIIFLLLILMGYGSHVAGRLRRYGRILAGDAERDAVVEAARAV